MQEEEIYRNYEKSHRRGKIMGGLLIVVIGTLFLMRELGVALPDWLLSWKTLLIGIGIVTAVKHKFRHPAWLILVGIGSVFLFSDFYPENQLKSLMWPLLAIAVGLFMMLRPRRQFGAFHPKRFNHWKQHRYKGWEHHRQSEVCASENDERIELVTIMGGVKKNLISKNFKGGEVVNIFGGTEINLMQADITNVARLEVVQVFGGVRLIVPANWQIHQTEVVTIFGNVEDKRPVNSSPVNEEVKQLLLVGVTVFGGIEIKSY